MTKFRDLVIELGATDAKIIGTDKVIIDERVIARCYSPRCSYYENPLVRLLYNRGAGHNRYFRGEKRVTHRRCERGKPLVRESSGYADKACLPTDAR